MAALAVIGGVDSRPRLGGMVHHKEHGLGTVARIAANGKITVQCQGNNKAHICSITQVKSVCLRMQFHLYPLNLSTTVEHLSTKGFPLVSNDR